MWWLIGIVGAAAAWAVFTKLRAASHQIQLIKAGRDHLWHSFQMLRAGSDSFFDKTVEPRVWEDRYLLGYAQGSLAIMVSAYGKRLKSAQRGLVIVRIFQDMAGPDWKRVCQKVETLSKDKAPEFERGMLEGSNVAILMANRPGPELLADPDVQAALRDAPEHARFVGQVFGESDSTPFATAGAVLMQEYMARHGAKAGYLKPEAATHG